MNHRYYYLNGRGTRLNDNWFLSPKISHRNMKKNIFLVLFHNWFRWYSLVQFVRHWPIQNEAPVRQPAKSYNLHLKLGVHRTVIVVWKIQKYYDNLCRMGMMVQNNGENWKLKKKTILVPKVNWHICTCTSQSHKQQSFNSSTIP